MTKKARYFLLAACVAVFLILAPLMVLYVRGITFNFKTGAFVQTGILAVRSEPGSVDVYLDGQKRLSKAGDLRFILPGEHQVTLKKPKFNDWGKRLEVLSGQVVWANPAFGSIYLLLSQPPVAEVADGVLDFDYRNGTALVLTKNNLAIASGAGLKTQKNITLPMPLSSIIAEDAAGKNFILAVSPGASGTPADLFFNSDSGKFGDLSKLFAGQTEFRFSDNGQLYALNKKTLYSVDPLGQTKNLIFNNIEAFGLQDGSVYFIQKSPTGTPALIVTEPPFNQTQTLFAALPNFNQVQIFITYQKQIFIKADDSLFLANNSMSKLADNVELVQFDPSSSVLAVLHAGELDYFDPLAGNLNFVTRSSGVLSNLQIRQNIGYALFQKGQEIDALELDTRDHQNQYVLYNGTDIKKAAINGGGQYLLVLDGGTLKILTIR